MPGLARAALFLCPLIFTVFIPSQAIASRTQGHDNCTNHGCTEIKTERVRVYRSARKSRSHRVRHERTRVRKVAPGHLVSIQCGPKQIRVASTAASQFRGFCSDLYAIYKFKWASGWSEKRGGECSTSNKHVCGGATDIDQSCRSRGPGHCLPGNFPVAASERLADKWGLWPGSRWGHRDVGHFETRGTLAGNGKWKVGDDVATLETPEAPKPSWPRVLPQTEKMVLASADPGDMLTDDSREVSQPKPQAPSIDRYYDSLMEAAAHEKVNLFQRYVETKEIVVRPGVRMTCDSGAPLPGRLVTLLEDAVQKFGGTVLVNSGFRSRDYNDRLRRRGIRAARNSQHIRCRAVDYRVAGVDSRVLYRWTRQQRGINGVGYYGPRGHVHADVRAARTQVTWDATRKRKYTKRKIRVASR